MKMAARIRRVLTGHSPVALVHAVTGDGLELKLEVPVADALGVGIGDVLVVEWDTFAIADAPAPVDAVEDGESFDPPPEDPAPVEEPPAPSPPTNPTASVRRALGLPT